MIFHQAGKVIPFLEVASWESNSQPPKSEFIYELHLFKIGYERYPLLTYIPLTKNLSIVDRFDILMDNMVMLEQFVTELRV